MMKAVNSFYVLNDYRVKITDQEVHNFIGSPCMDSFKMLASMEILLYPQ